MKWENYHVKIYFPKHKPDQKKLNKHEAVMYLNPNDPSVCPLRVLASYDYPVITGIPIHCSLLNRLMEVHQM